MGMGVGDFRAVILNKVGSKRALDDRPIRGDVGMSERDVEQFSIAKAIRAMADNDWQRAGLEREVLKATEKFRTRQNSFVLPNELMRRDVMKSGSGANLVGVEFLGDRFIDALYTESDVLNRLHFIIWFNARYRHPTNDFSKFVCLVQRRRDN